MNNNLIRTSLCLLLIFSTAIQAEIWQIGMLAETSQSPFLAERRDTSALPMVNYIGDNFSFIGGNIEYRLNTKGNSETYIVGQFRSRQFYSAGLDSSDDLNIEGMENRDTAFETGLGLKNQTTIGQIVLQGVTDVSNAHEGYELTARYSYPIQSGPWLFEPAIGLQLQSSELVDYYHGIMVSESSNTLPAYQGSQAINTLASVMVGYKINARLLAIASLEEISLDKSIVESPIVSRDRVQKLYMGIIYTF